MELIVFALAASAIAGTIGSTVNATVVLYAAEPTTVTVNAQAYTLRANETRTIAVPLHVSHEREVKHIMVETKTIRADLPVTVFGDLSVIALAPLLLFPAACFVASVRIRKYDNNNLSRFETPSGNNREVTESQTCAENS